MTDSDLDLRIKQSVLEQAFRIMGYLPRKINDHSTLSDDEEGYVEEEDDEKDDNDDDYDEESGKTEIESASEKKIDSSVYNAASVSLPMAQRTIGRKMLKDNASSSSSIAVDDDNCFDDYKADETEKGKNVGEGEETRMMSRAERLERIERLSRPRARIVVPSTASSSSASSSSSSSRDKAETTLHPLALKRSSSCEGVSDQRGRPGECGEKKAFSSLSLSPPLLRQCSASGSSVQSSLSSSSMVRPFISSCSAGSVSFAHMEKNREAERNSKAKRCVEMKKNSAVTSTLHHTSSSCFSCSLLSSSSLSSSLPSSFTSMAKEVQTASTNSAPKIDEEDTNRKDREEEKVMKVSRRKVEGKPYYIDKYGNCVYNPPLLPQPLGIKFVCLTPSDPLRAPVSLFVSFVDD